MDFDTNSNMALSYSEFLKFVTASTSAKIRCSSRPSVHSYHNRHSSLGMDADLAYYLELLMNAEAQYQMNVKNRRDVLANDSNWDIDIGFNELDTSSPSNYITKSEIDSYCDDWGYRSLSSAELDGIMRRYDVVSGDDMLNYNEYVIVVHGHEPVTCDYSARHPVGKFF